MTPDTERARDAAAIAALPRASVDARLLTAERALRTILRLSSDRVSTQIAAAALAQTRVQQDELLRGSLIGFP